MTEEDRLKGTLRLTTANDFATPSSPHSETATVNKYEPALISLSLKWYIPTVQTQIFCVRRTRRWTRGAQCSNLHGNPNNAISRTGGTHFMKAANELRAYLSCSPLI